MVPLVPRTHVISRVWMGNPETSAILWGREDQDSHAYLADQMTPVDAVVPEGPGGSGEPPRPKSWRTYSRSPR